MISFDSFYVTHSHEGHDQFFQGHATVDHDLVTLRHEGPTPSCEQRHEVRRKSSDIKKEGVRICRCCLRNQSLTAIRPDTLSAQFRCDTLVRATNSYRFGIAVVGGQVDMES